MAPPALATLYCQPSDIYDYLSTEGGDLRLDDHNLATGQTILVSPNQGNVGDTTLNVTPLIFPLLAGTVLQFDGGGDPANVQVTVSATATVGTVQLSVLPLPAALNPNSQASDSGVNLATAARLAKACSYGTARVKLYCCSRYNDSDLVNSWSVNHWATALGSLWLCTRRGQSPPKSVAQDADDAMEELRMVRVSQLNIEDIPTRDVGWPFFSNMTIDLGYDYTKLRVESNISEGTPTHYGQLVDWNSVLWLEW